jgi:DNA-binding response OmpR family regulator
VAGTARKTILLVEEDNDLRPMLRMSLEKAGYLVLLAVDEESAISWIGTASFPFNLILINLVNRRPEEVLQSGRRIRQRAGRNGDTPIVVMAEKFSQDLAGTWLKAGENDWIIYQEGEALQFLLAQIIPPAA